MIAFEPGWNHMNRYVLSASSPSEEKRTETHEEAISTAVLDELEERVDDAGSDHHCANVLVHVDVRE